MNYRIKGFTLIELLVVVAIVGILSSVILANLNGSRQKARDTKRIADVKSLQLALELYKDVNGGKYPGTLASGDQTELVPTYISSIPTPPVGVTGVTAYTYVPLNINGGTCNGYHLGAALEVVSSTVLRDDSDASAGSVAVSGCGGAQAPGGTVDFSGLGQPKCTDAAGTSQPGGTEACFDVTQ